MAQQRLEHPSIMVTLDIRGNLFLSENGAATGTECAILRQACAMAVAAIGGGVQAPGWPRKHAAHQPSPNASQPAEDSNRARLRGKSIRRDARQTSFGGKVVNGLRWSSVAWVEDDIALQCQ
jgi:hypothetical protein